MLRCVWVVWGSQARPWHWNSLLGLWHLGSWGSPSTRGAELAATSSKDLCQCSSQKGFIPVQTHKKPSRLAVQASVQCLHLGKPSLMLTESSSLENLFKSTGVQTWHYLQRKGFSRGNVAMLVCGFGLWLFAFQRSNISIAVAFESLSNSKKSFQASSWTTRLWFPSVTGFGVNWWCFPSDGWQATEMNQNAWDFFSCLEYQLVVASALLSKCGICLLLRLGMWHNWKPQTKQLEAKLKPCFIPQHLREIVQIEKIKELFSDLMVCLACSPLLFCIKVANTKTFRVVPPHLEFFIVTSKHSPMAFCAFGSSWPEPCLLVPSEPNSPTGKQCAQLQHCRSKTGPEMLYSRTTDTKGMWDKWKKIGWKLLMPGKSMVGSS